MKPSNSDKPVKSTPSNPPPSSSSSSSDKNKNRLPKRKNDADCWNCVGVTYYSEVLKKNGIKPKCYGVEYISGKQITPEIMEALEEMPPIEKNAGVWIVGMAQSSLRMHRVGQAPLLRFGLRFQQDMTEKLAEKRKNNTNASATEAIKKESVAVSKETSPSEASPTPLSPPPVTSPAPPPQPASTRNPVESPTSSFSSFLQAYQRGCGRLITNMDKVYKKCSDDFLNRLQKGSIKMIDSCNKFAGKVASRLYHSLFPSDKDNNQPPPKR